jgi:multidrug efflux pump subunit AcrB
MWIVRLALRKPYTFVVLAIVILILGPLAILRTPTDVFPTINIPVVSVIWNYSGLNPTEMSNRIVSVTERSLTTTVDDIQHIESQSLRGVAVVKIFFQPSARIERAIAQVTAVSQTQLRQLPPGPTSSRRWSTSTTRACGQRRRSWRRRARWSVSRAPTTSRR